jgi:hypothetical protein
VTGFGEHEGRRGRAGCRRLLKPREREQGGKEGVRGSDVVAAREKGLRPGCEA